LAAESFQKFGSHLQYYYVVCV